MSKTVNTRKHIGMFNELTDQRLEYGFYYMLYFYPGWGQYYIPN
jgi:hypothetical protein